MLSWADFYRGLANEATLRAAQMANSSKKDKLEEVAKEWWSMTAWVIHIIPVIPACPVRPKSGHSANVRVYEYAH